MTSRRAILVVDDDESLRGIKARVLEEQEFDIDQASSGERAIDRIEAKVPDLVLLAVKLPGMDGLQTCRAIKKRWPSVLVLHTSAEYRESADRTRGLESGADGYLDEPIESRELVASVKSLLRTRQIESDLRIAVERNQMLLREVQHRTMNNLQLVISFLNLESRRLTDPLAKERIKAVTQRVSALAAVHQHLYSRGGVDRIDFGSYVEDLAKDISTATAESRIVVRARTEPLWMEADRAVRLGLVVNELVTNAVKYAFLEGQGGGINLDMRRTGPNAAVLDIEDDGRGFGAGGNNGSTHSGLNLAKALAEQSDAEIVREPAEKGTRWRLLMNDPAERKKAETAAS